MTLKELSLSQKTELTSACFTDLKSWTLTIENNEVFREQHKIAFDIVRTIYKINESTSIK
ncbi:hypothetical protein [Olleya sp. ITB9]|uniref:hypothetical protein n=1 Tax=Olleya sp. ITB9 TaxID=1715648 RepID=UPI0006D16C3C|nr:hypothetical protein [Olleya sp. ITB9]